MTTLFTHPVVPLAIGLALGSRIIPPRLLLLGVVASLLPDLDVVAFRLGIAYGSEFGHRGFSHSILLALLVALLGGCFCRSLRSTFVTTFLFLFVATLSHSVLDSFTNGGMGVAWLWPWSDERFFAPVQVIEVSPISLRRFFSERGAVVLWSELQWVWLPLVGLALAGFIARRWYGGSSTGAK